MRPIPARIGTLLREADHLTLVVLIENLLAVEPSLADLILAALDRPSSEPFDPGPTRRRADAIFDRHDPGWSSRIIIPTLLERLESTAEALTRSGRGRAAASVYAGLLLSISQHMEWQDECEYDWVLERCVERLNDALEAETEPAVREEMVAVYGEILLNEIGGGYDLQRYVAEPFVREATDAQRRALIAAACATLREREREDIQAPLYYRAGVYRWLERLLPGEDPLRWLPPPSDALPHLKQKVEAILAKKHSRDYHEACRWLKRVEGCYQMSGDTEGFAPYLAELRERYRKRPAFRDALRRAQL